ncbi:MAG: hypothetical protein CL583_01930 [Alteromonadaceae bacterium]|nr:hypothetical protein [Alteromonadaceae bacterium]|tara:strand:+ start:4288 stop:4671 length:384 start_codon:yes stop_codon:yes gene_type:complete
MNNTCAVTQDLDRYQGEIDAEAAREEWADNEWPDLKADIAERVMCKQGIRVTDKRGERTIIDWESVVDEIHGEDAFHEAMMIATEDHAECGRLMEIAQRAVAEAHVEAHKDDLLDELRREQGGFGGE